MVLYIRVTDAGICSDRRGGKGAKGIEAERSLVVGDLAWQNNFLVEWSYRESYSGARK